MHQAIILEASAPTDFFIRAQSSMAEARPRILKHGDTFGVFDHHGDILPTAEGNGLYHRDTRHLSGLQLFVAGRHPMLLSSNVRLNNAVLRADLTNPDILDGDGVLALARDLLHMTRSRFIWQGCSYERLAVHNFAPQAVEVDVDLAFAADFADLFEARGMPRTSRGAVRTEVRKDAGTVTFVYDGQDGCQRTTALRFEPAPTVLTRTRARYRLNLLPGQQSVMFVLVECDGGGLAMTPARAFFHGIRHARRPIRQVAARAAAIAASHEVVNEVLCRSAADLTMLMTETVGGPYPYAGVPWYSTPFGRDGLITALLMLWADPALARGVLSVLAATQATTEDAAADAEPGKIVHEMREGEMARLGLVPFRRYYGTVDATPLFVVLAGAYLARTGDLDAIRVLDPHIQAALRWMESYGDRDGDGFLEYGRRREDGLINQGWKDSHDSIFHATGEIARGPIALVEVQGYAYAAYLAAADLAVALGRPDEAARRLGQAESLRAAVEERFWCEDMGLYALALDGEKRPCAVRTSNAGQLLFSGLPSPTRARRVADAMLAPEFFSGFGIRTVAEGDARYNPMSYHNGSIWPHDNAMIALGMSRYGLKRPVLRVMEGLFDTAAFMDLRRLPELFCGFRRVRGAAPTLYPVACSPQAWASATPFALVQAALGLGFDPARRTIRLDRPRLPAALTEMRIGNLVLGDGAVDLLLTRAGKDVAVNVLDRRGDVEVVVTV
ncbi:glycogen debranching N-terminal domain-containing protein [Novispirillum sp. DQ9]|uniref:amylo-alpha-1,6-glucosidase n=1 Tax=Novispirillum sp. DQ9 TaxID=3398612 RepID=UPI003C7AFDA7